MVKWWQEKPIRLVQTNLREIDTRRDPRQIVREVGSLYEGLREGLTVETRLPDRDIRAVVDPVLLRQGLVNLLDNATDAVTGDGHIVVYRGSHDGVPELELHSAGCDTSQVNDALAVGDQLVVAPAMRAPFALPLP